MRAMTAKRKREEDDDDFIERPAEIPRTNLPDSPIPSNSQETKLGETNHPQECLGPKSELCQKCPEYFCNCIPPTDQLQTWWSPDDSNGSSCSAMETASSIDCDDWIDQEPLVFHDPLIEYDQMGFRRLPHVLLKQQPVTKTDEIFMGLGGCLNFHEYLEMKGHEHRTIDQRKAGRPPRVKGYKLPGWLPREKYAVKTAVYLPYYIKSKFHKAHEVTSIKNIVLPVLEKRRLRRKCAFLGYEDQEPFTIGGEINSEKIWGTLEEDLTDGELKRAQRSIWLQKSVLKPRPFKHERRWEIQSNQLLRNVTLRHKTHLRYMTKDGFKSTLSIATSVDDIEAESEKEVELEPEKKETGREVEDSSNESDEDKDGDEDQTSVAN